MMPEKRRVYTAEFKREAVRLVTEHGYGVTEAARNLGINVKMLGRWQRQAEQQTNGRFGSNRPRSAENEDLLRLRQVKNVPGRKTDVHDACWLQQLHQHGLL
jgi:transposase